VGIGADRVALEAAFVFEHPAGARLQRA